MICNKAILNSFSVLHFKLSFICITADVQRFIYGSVSEYNCALHAPAINHCTVMLQNTGHFPKKEKLGNEKIELPLITFENIRGTLSVH